MVGYYGCIHGERAKGYTEFRRKATRVRANQFFKVEILLGRQLYCRPQGMPAIQGWQYNCRPNTAKD
jgi:hypothetical protein